MPGLEPTMHEFVSSYKHYRKQGIMPSGWQERKPTKRPRRCFVCRLFERCRGSKSKSRLKEIRHSMTEMSRPDSEGIEEVTVLLSLTVPDRPIRAWCPTPWFFVPHDAVRIICFEADGLILQRVPVWGELLGNRKRKTVQIQSWTIHPRSQVASLCGSSMSSLRLPSSVPSWSERRDSVVERNYDDSEFTPGMGSFDEYLITEQKYLAFGGESGMTEFEWLLPAITYWNPWNERW